MQLLIDRDGAMRNVTSLLAGDVHLGWLDAYVHLLLAGNNVKQLVDQRNFKLLNKLLQVGQLPGGGTIYLGGSGEGGLFLTSQTRGYRARWMVPDFPSQSTRGLVK